MEITSVSAFIDYYSRIRERTMRLVAVVPPDKMDWAYKPGKYSIADMLRHIATIERYMFGETIQGKPSLYNGCDKEYADGYEEVVGFMNEMHRQTLEIIRNLGDTGLQRKCRTPAGTEITVWKWLRGMVEHEIHHRGELYIYLNLLDIKTPQIFGLSAEEVQALQGK